MRAIFDLLMTHWRIQQHAYAIVFSYLLASPKKIYGFLLEASAILRPLEPIGLLLAIAGLGFTLFEISETRRLQNEQLEVQQAQALISKINAIQSAFDAIEFASQKHLNSPGIIRIDFGENEAIEYLVSINPNFLRDARLHGLHLIGLELASAPLFNTHLNSVKFFGVNLQGSNFGGVLDGVELTSGNNLDGTGFGQACIMGSIIDLSQGNENLLYFSVVSGSVASRSFLPKEGSSIILPENNPDKLIWQNFDRAYLDNVRISGSIENASFDQTMMRNVDFSGISEIEDIDKLQSNFKTVCKIKNAIITGLPFEIPICRDSQRVSEALLRLASCEERARRIVVENQPIL